MTMRINNIPLSIIIKTWFIRKLGLGGSYKWAIKQLENGEEVYRWDTERKARYIMCDNKEIVMMLNGEWKAPRLMYDEFNSVDWRIYRTRKSRPKGLLEATIINKWKDALDSVPSNGLSLGQKVFAKTVPSECIQPMENVEESKSVFEQLGLSPIDSGSTGNIEQIVTNLNYIDFPSNSIHPVYTDLETKTGLSPKEIKPTYIDWARKENPYWNLIYSTFHLTLVMNANDFFGYCCADCLEIDSYDCIWAAPIIEEYGTDGVNAFMAYIAQQMPISPYQTKRFKEAYKCIKKLNPQVESWDNE